MSFLDPEPQPRRLRLFALAGIPFALLLVLDRFKIVDAHGWAAPLLLVFVVGFTIWDSTIRRREGAEECDEAPRPEAP